MISNIYGSSMNLDSDMVLIHACVCVCLYRENQYATNSIRTIELWLMHTVFIQPFVCGMLHSHKRDVIFQPDTRHTVTCVTPGFDRVCRLLRITQVPIEVWRDLIPDKEDSFNHIFCYKISSTSAASMCI